MSVVGFRVARVAASALLCLAASAYAQSDPSARREVPDDAMRRQIERERAQQDAQVPHADVLRPAVDARQVLTHLVHSRLTHHESSQ